MLLYDILIEDLINSIIEQLFIINTTLLTMTIDTHIFKCDVV